LRAGADGRIRFDGDRRLPLPEGLLGLVRLDADTLGAGTPPDLFADRDVVLVWDDPAVGRKELAPGLAAPVDRGELLAVALASTRADASLRVLPLGAAAGLVALVGLITRLVLGRSSPRRGALVALALAAALALGVVLLRRSGVDLPWIGLLSAVAFAYLARLVELYRVTLTTLDHIVLRLGSPAVEPVVPDPADLVRVLASAPSEPVPAAGLEPRLAEAEAAVGRALARAERWEHLLGGEGLTIGVFGLSGGLTFASARMAALATSEPAIEAVVGALTGLGGAPLAARLHETLTAEGPVLVYGTAPYRTVLLHALGPPDARTGVLVQAVGAPIDRRKAGPVETPDTAETRDTAGTRSPLASSSASRAGLGTPPSTS
jgi:hypothetical protein